MSSTNATPTPPKQPSVWKKLQNKPWFLKSRKSRLSLDDRSTQPKPRGIRRMLSSRLGSSRKTAHPWPSSVWSKEPFHSVPEEAPPPTSRKEFPQRSASHTPDSFVRPRNPFIDYDFFPPSCMRGSSTPKSSIVVEASEVETVYSDDGDPSGHEFDRRNFKRIRGISRSLLQAMVLDLVDPEGELSPGCCRVTQRKEGSFHHAVFLEIERGDDVALEYVLRIPAHGMSASWHINDAMMLECEAQLMQHIRYHTGCPVPEVIAYDGSRSNTIGAPYILMKKMEGIPATDLWLGQAYSTIANTELHLNADDPSPEVEQRRITFLRSLAQAMSELASLEFPYTGAPAYSDPKDKEPKFIAPTWRWHSKIVMTEPASGGSYETSEAFFAAGLDTAFEAEREITPDGDEMVETGVLMVMNIVLSSDPFKPSPSSNGRNPGVSNSVPTREIFILRHDDVDLQNILVDDDGNVTGIIDWDGCAAVPRCVGYTSMPTFLRRDWLPDYTLNRLPHMSWAIERYRKVYADAIDAFCKSSDAKYTRKSTMYQLILAALERDLPCIEVVEILFQEMPEFRRVDVKLFCRRLGQGWPAAEEVLTVKIGELLKSE